MRLPTLPSTTESHGYKPSTKESGWFGFQNLLISLVLGKPMDECVRLKTRCEIPKSRGRKPLVLGLQEETMLWEKGVRYVAGVDEVGRGPLAGPVVAAAVIIKSPAGINRDLKIRDSKKLSSKQRDKIFEVLTNNKDVDCGIGIVSESVIDKTNILEASLLAMKQAINGLKTAPEFILIDGQHTLEDIMLNQKAIINGDAKVFSIAAASIMAKVTRDRLMIEYNGKYPNYGFDAHKGYGTKQHLEALKKYGPCAIHRKSFGPVKKLL